MVTALWHYSLSNAPTKITIPIKHPDIASRPAPPCMLSNGLPLLFSDGVLELVVDELVCACCAGVVGTGGREVVIMTLDCAALVLLDELEVEMGELVASNIDVLVLPDIVVLGCTSTGTIMTNVAPSSFVVVCMTVVVKVGTWSPSSDSVVWAFDVCEGLNRVVVDSSWDVSVASHCALLMIEEGIRFPIDRQYA